MGDTGTGKQHAKRATDEEHAKLFGSSRRRKYEDRDEETTRDAYAEFERKASAQDRSLQKGSAGLPAQPVADGVGEVGRAFYDLVGERGWASGGLRTERRYRRHRPDVVLGLQGSVAIDRVRDRDVGGLHLYWKPGTGSSLSSRVRLPDIPPPGKIRRLAISSEPIDYADPFILLPGRRRDDETLRDEMRLEADYESDEDFAAEFEDMPLADRARLDTVAQIEAELRAAPNNPALWLRYSRQHFPSPRQHRAIDQDTASVEVALSILDKAFAAHPVNNQSVDLHLAYLHHLNSVWSNARIAQRWAETVRRFPLVSGTIFEQSAVPLHFAYLEWLQAGGAGALADDRHDAVDALSVVFMRTIGVMRDCLLDTGPSVDIEETLLRLFLRYIFFLKNNGSTEKAYAAMQALMELTFFNPPYMAYRGGQPRRWYEQLVQDFEAFWDSEAPRFGEPAAQGWGASAAEGTLGDGEPSADETTLDGWFDAEVQADKLFEQPARLSIELSTDPFRIVIFADIAPCLFPVLSTEVRLETAYALFSFLGIPISPPDSSSNTWSTTDAQSSFGADKTTRDRMWPARPSDTSLPWRDKPAGQQGRLYTKCPVKSWISDSRTLLAAADWFSDLSAADVHHVDYDYARNAMSLLLPIIPDPRFKVLYISLEAAKSVKRAGIVAKEILRVDTDNAVMWDAFARLERIRGRPDSARAVYCQNLAKIRTAGSTGRGEMDLWLGLIELEVAERDTARIEDVLSLFCGGTPEDILARVHKGFSPPPASATTRLRTRQRLQHSAEHMAINLYAVFLAHIDGEVEAACDLLESQLDADRLSAAKELKRQRYLAFLLALPVPPHTRIRHLADSSVINYPNNTMILSAQLRIGRQGRDIVNTVSRLEDREQLSVPNTAWAVWAAGAVAGEQFWKNGSAERERVRALLDKAVSSKSGSTSAAAWLLYIDFEIMFNTAKAKSLCYRAINHAGLCKAVFMLPFRSDFIAAFTKRELYDWTQVMLERGIRVRVPVPLAAGDLEPLITLPEDEELQDDELEFLRERERLKPYDSLPALK